jgi:tetratricopeptide (TPR) repeat protein
VPATLAALVADCLAKDAQRRPTLSQILGRVPAPDDSGRSWLPPTVTTMLDERDVAPPTPGDAFSPETGPDADVEHGADSAPEKDQEGLPHHIDALIGLARLERDSGNLAEARRLFQQAIEAGRTPEQTAKALTDLGWIETQDGNPDKGRRLYQQAIELGTPSQKDQLLNVWGLLEKGVGNAEKARGLFKRAIESGRWGLVLAASWNLAVVEVEAGNLEEVRRLLQQATEADGPPERKADGLMYWADVERGVGNDERARQLYKQVLDAK